MLPIGTRVRVLQIADCSRQKAVPGDMLTIVDHFAFKDGYHTDDKSQWYDYEVEAVDEGFGEFIPPPIKRKRRDA